MPKMDDATPIDLDSLFDRADDLVASSVTGRPKTDSGYTPKVSTKIRLDPDVISWLKGMGPRHFSRINAILTALMEEQQRKESGQ